MRDFILTRLGLLVVSITFIGPVYAQTATTQFNVQITILAECQIDSASDLDFGDAGVIDADIDAESAIAVTCTTDTDYQLGLDAGQTAGATINTRAMTGPGGAAITYQLFQDAGRTTIWGNTPGTDTVSGTGNGMSQNHIVYGRVPGGQAGPPPGAYTDVITATVTY